MGKNQSASNLPNIIQYSNGSINFVSGSTLLMQISSSGAITTTGVISGSNALSSSYAVNSDQLDGFDSTAFVFTSSFNTYSSSMSTRTSNLESTGSTLTTASASFAVVSSSYSSASGSLSTRVTTLEAASASLNTASGSFSTRTTTLENASSSLNTASGSFSTRVTRIEGNYATTGSNIFTGAQTVCANITSTGTIIAQTLNVQQVTSSVVYSSGSNVFGCSLANTQQFTGSVLITGSLVVTTTAPELTVGATGVTLGNVITDIHNITGSLRITGSLNTIGNACVTSICSPAIVGGTVSGTTGVFSGQVCANSNLTAAGIIYGRTTNNFPTTGAGYYAITTNNFDAERGGITIQVSCATNTLATALTINYLGATTLASSLIVNNATTDGAGALQVKALAGNQSAARIASTTNNNLFNFISNAAAGHAILDFGRCTESGIFAAGYIRLRTDGDSWIQGGNVGIGTSSPDTLLTLDTQIANSSTGILASLYASKGTAEGTYLQIRGTRNSTQSVRRIEFQACDGSSNAANIVLNPSGGCVGIGTFTPNSRFHIFQTGQPDISCGLYATQILQTDSQANYQRIRFDRDSCPFWGIGVEGASSTNDLIISGLIGGKTSGTWSDNVFRIKNSNGNIGINTGDPKANFHVCGGSATLRVGPWFSTNDRDFIQLEASGTDTRILSPNERFKIENPDGCVQIVSGTSGGVQLTPGATSWASMSDMRKKKNFEPTQGLAALLQIEPVKYHFQWDNDCIPKRMGFIAQNIQPLIPEMVSKTDEKAEDGSDYLTITPDYILPVLVKSIQEQQCTICMQSTIIEQLKYCLGLI